MIAVPLWEQILFDVRVNKFKLVVKAMLLFSLVFFFLHNIPMLKKRSTLASM